MPFPLKPRFTIFSKFRNPPKPLQKISRPQLTWRDGRNHAWHSRSFPCCHCVCLACWTDDEMPDTWDLQMSDQGTTLPKFAKYYRGWHPTHLYFQGFLNAAKKWFHEEFDVCDFIDLTSKLFRLLNCKKRCWSLFMAKIRSRPFPTQKKEHPTWASTLRWCIHSVGIWALSQCFTCF